MESSLHPTLLTLYLVNICPVQKKLAFYPHPFNFSQKLHSDRLFSFTYTSKRSCCHTSPIDPLMTIITFKIKVYLKINLKIDYFFAKSNDWVIASFIQKYGNPFCHLCDEIFSNNTKYFLCSCWWWADRKLLMFVAIDFFQLSCNFLDWSERLMDRGFFHEVALV